MDTLLSIQNQTFTEWECLIIDDGGTDETKAVISKLLTYDRRFTFHQRPEQHLKGLPGCRNYGLSLATGKYVVFFDDDDWIHPQHLMLTTSLLDNHIQYGFCQYQKQSFETSMPENVPFYSNLTPLRETGVQQLPAIVQEKIGMASCTVVWRMHYFTERFNEQLQYAEEWELYTRILATGIKGMEVNEVLYYNRKHAASNTGEFWNGNRIRIDAKMQAALCNIKTLQYYHLLDTQSQTYLLNILIRNRGYQYFKSGIAFSNYNLLQKWKAYLYYFCFPLIFIFYSLYHRLQP